MYLALYTLYVISLYQRNYNNNKNDYQQRNYNNNNNYYQAQHEQQPPQLMDNDYKNNKPQRNSGHQHHPQRNSNDSPDDSTDGSSYKHNNNNNTKNQSSPYNNIRPPHQSPTVRGGGRPHHTPGYSNFHRPNSEQQDEFDPYKQAPTQFGNSRRDGRGGGNSYGNYQQQPMEQSNHTDSFEKQHHGDLQHFNNSRGGYQQQQRYNRGGGGIPRGGMRGAPIMGTGGPTKGRRGGF